MKILINYEIEFDDGMITAEEAKQIVKVLDEQIIEMCRDYYGAMVTGGVVMIEKEVENGS